MLARCARCQGTFTTETFGLQTCPHCGSELMLADPSGGATPPAASPPAGHLRRRRPAPAAAAEPAAASMAAPPPPPPPSGWGPLHPPPPPTWSEQASPFAERSTRGFFSSFFETFKLVGTQPADFFRRVRIDQTGAALLFGVIGSTVGNWASLLFGALTRAATSAQLQARMSELPPEMARFLEQFASTIQGLTSPAATAVQMLIAPLVSLISIYIGAGVIHLLLMLFKGAGRGFDATLTVVAYASGLYLVDGRPPVRRAHRHGLVPRRRHHRPRRGPALRGGQGGAGRLHAGHPPLPLLLRPGRHRRGRRVERRSSRRPRPPSTSPVP